MKGYKADEDGLIRKSDAIRICYGYNGDGYICAAIAKKIRALPDVEPELPKMHGSMTIEEAVKILETGSTFAYDEKQANEFCEAYDMAIRALKSVEILADELDGAPSYRPCDKI